MHRTRSALTWLVAGMLTLVASVGVEVATHHAFSSLNHSALAATTPSTSSSTSVKTTRTHQRSDDDANTVTSESSNDSNGD